MTGLINGVGRLQEKMLGKDLCFPYFVTDVMSLNNQVIRIGKTFLSSQLFKHFPYIPRKSLLTKPTPTLPHCRHHRLMKGLLASIHNSFVLLCMSALPSTTIPGDFMTQPLQFRRPLRTRNALVWVFHWHMIGDCMSKIVKK